MSMTASSVRMTATHSTAQRTTGPSPALGAHLRDGGVDVAVVAPLASAVDLCLLDPEPSSPTGFTERRYALHRGPHGVWQGRVPDVHSGQRYGYRVHGRWDPAAGLRHNPDKLLLDPYTRGVTGEFRLGPEVYGHTVNEDLAPVAGWHRSELDSAGHVPHGVLLDDVAPVPDHARPHVPWERTVIYEAHVRGLTMQLPGVPEHLRGTYAGLAHPATIAHLQSLGVTAVELLPIHAAGDEPFLLERGLTNYWGYNTLAFLAPEPCYATREAREQGAAAVLDEVRGMVHLLHQAGIEVLLDVVYNHTCEGGDGGPTLSWRGLDNAGYYMHDGVRPAHMVDVTGTGNSLDFRRTRVVQLTLDSLRYWVQYVGIDGFRFDLATTLGRNGAEFTPDHPFFVAVATDPVLSRVKLIAEPWDVGPGGWRTGEFPAPFADWNDRFRDAARTFWLSDPATGVAGGTGEDLRDLATRLAGSADLFAHGPVPGGRGPLASINYVTAHDGFTLADLVTYNLKHNEANGEDNRDGSDDNRSWNHEVEGPVTVPADEPRDERGGPGDAAAAAGWTPREHHRGADILAGRRRSVRNLLGTLLLSAGTPMLTAGDELGRSQRGNNNAYCQDNEISWVDWELAPWQEELLATSRYLLRLRREHRVLRPDVFATGHTAPGDTIPDLSWYRQDAGPMSPGDWHDSHVRVLQMLRSGRPFGDSDLLLVLNGSLADQTVTAPRGAGVTYELVWDSSWEHPPQDPTPAERLAPGATTEMAGLSLRVYLAQR